MIIKKKLHHRSLEKSISKLYKRALEEIELKNSINVEKQFEQDDEKTIMDSELHRSLNVKTIKQQKEAIM